jgi:hypothetical protein
MTGAQDLMRDCYLKFSSKELKQKLVTYNKALPGLDVKTRDAIHGYMNEIIDILKERDEL